MRFLVAFLLVSGSTALDPDDLKRARTWTPRSGFRGRGTLVSANAQLNKHLVARTGLRLQACEEFTTPDLRAVLHTLRPLASDELKRIYAEKDGRSPKYASASEMEAHWQESAPIDDIRVRDAHCHEAVMWFTHHLTTEVQEGIKGRITLPMLPAAEHTLKDASRDSADKAGIFYDSKVTCQKCHNGGIDSLGTPETKPETAKSKIRRCYTNYKDLFNMTCGPCDGIAGIYTGDADKYFTPPNCIVVGTPEEIPEAERVKVVMPHQFSVDIVGGSDRFGRATSPDASPLPPLVAKFYGQITGKWFMDAKPDSDLWLLRHDTVYGSATEDGTPIPFIKPSVTEIHAQTAKMMAENDTGPMVSLIHGLPNWMPGGCTCMPDPVGVPDISASVRKTKDGHDATKLANMDYMGRIKIAPLEYLGGTVELDHYADWFFHIFMEVNKSAPFYGKAPRRLGSAYAGFAVYDNWVFEDPKIADPTVWYRGIPTSPEKVGPSKGKFCFDTQKVGKYCSDISQSTFPMKPEPAPQSLASKSTEGAHATINHPFFPSGHALAHHVTRTQAEKKADIVV